MSTFTIKYDKLRPTQSPTPQTYLDSIDALNQLMFFSNGFFSWLRSLSSDFMLTP
jgi:hypothetical protein